ncbi:hypothetical protein LUZ60_002849 [Juncus effusus]|nr:hypothetical protein LUZ60_002849 [Juncus effusus]
MASLCADTDIIRTDGSAHRFRINYSKIKDMGIGQCITSPTFKSEGCQWAISFYPKGHYRENEGEYSSLFLRLLDDHKGLNVSVALGIIKGDGTQGMDMALGRSNLTFITSASKWGSWRFIERTTLEERLATNGFFVVLCTVNMKDMVSDELPILADISKLWETGEMADVKFEVDGEIISAHRVILGARSPVFKAELFGSISETKMDCIKINDMKSEVFRALLRFVYTCALPNDADTDMIQYLLVGADRYGIVELIKRCEESLIENISLETIFDLTLIKAKIILNNNDSPKSLHKMCLKPPVTSRPPVHFSAQ